MLLRTVALTVFLSGTAIAQTGTAVPSLAPFDQLMTGLLSKYGIPGGSIALTKNGRLIFARGYGFADADAQIPAQPDSRYRIASLSKAITAVTVMHLVEQGLLTLDQPAFALLPDLQPPAGSRPDPRLDSVTIRNLLNHAGGWDDTATGSNFDPMFNSPKITQALGVPAPASTENIIRYMRGQPLQFAPGTQYAYSNFGYAVIGRIIERVTGMSYEQYVQQNVLAPMGISQMRIGQTQPQGQLPNEVRYKSPGNQLSVFPDVVSPVPAPYGAWYMEAMDSHGGWVASAIDYAKFMNAIDGTRGARFLTAASVAQMLTLPAGVSTWIGSKYWYGFGFDINTAGNWWHTGSLDGTATEAIRSKDGFVFVIFLNHRGSSYIEINNLANDVDQLFWNASAQVTSWPTNDFFATSYPDAPVSATRAAPALTTREGVVNGATFDRGIVSGSWITLFGSNLSGTTRTWSGADIVNGTLPTALDNVSVKINGQPAFVYFVSPNQINVQAPAGLTPGWVTASVTYNGATTGNILTHAVSNAPGALTYLAGGNTFAVATAPDGTIIGDPSVVPGTRFAAPGSTVVIYASGLAVSDAGTATPAGLNLTSSTQVTIGGAPTALTFAGLISPGLFQINATVPSVANGNQPVAVKISGVQSPSGVSIAVHQ